MTGTDERFPDRAALVDLVQDASSPQAALREALGERHLLWRCCGEAVRTDPSWLLDGDCEQLRSWFKETEPDLAADSVTATDHAWLLGRALSAPQEHGEALARLAEAWRQSKLVSADAAPGPAQLSVKGFSLRVADALRSVTERIQDPREEESTGTQNTLMIAALLMAGAQPRRRPVVSVPVVLARSGEEDGVTGILELREFPAGPVGLYPDPRAMAGTGSPNGQFADSVGRAWLTAGPRRQGRCVLWRLVLSDDSVPPARIEGPSLGVAFALSLRDLLRYPPTRRPAVARLRGVFYGLRPRTAVTGRLSADERVLKVSGMDAKLLAAHRKGLRLIAPEANRLDLLKAPEPGEVMFAATLKQADRYARRFRTGRLAIALSLVGAVAATGLVVTYQDTAAKERLATAHRLANLSQRLLQTDAGLAELFAVQAYRYNADPLTRAALFQAVTASPHLVGSVQAGGPVSALASSADGHLMLAGTGQGEVEQWSLTRRAGGPAAGPARRLGRLPGSVTAVAADANGGTVAAIDHGTIRAWASAQPIPTPQTPAGQRPTAVGVSPSGRFVAVTTTSGTYGVSATMWVLDRTTGNTTHIQLDLPAAAHAIAFPSDSEVMTIEDAYGRWERFSLPAAVRTGGSTVGFGTHNQAFALAPDGSSFSYANGAATLPVWKSKGKPDSQKPSLLAQTHAGSPTAALALAPGGTWTAEAADTSIYLSRAAVPGETPPAPITLTGAGAISHGALAFLGGDGTRLISASGDVLNLWDITQYSRISTAAAANIPFGCNACDPPDVVPSPNGRTAAVIDGNGAVLDIQDLPPGAVQYSPRAPLFGDQRYAVAQWQSNGRGLVVVSQLDGSAKIVSVTPGGGRIIGTWPSLKVPDPAVLLRSLPGGRRMAEVDRSGTIRFRDAATGKVLRQLNGPKDMGSLDLHKDEAALDPKADHAAVIDPGSLLEPGEPKIVVTDTATGHTRTLPATDALGVAYTANHLLIQRRNGNMEIWTASGDRRLGTLEGMTNSDVGPVVGADDFIAEASYSTVRLIDLQSGQALGTLTVPSGIRDTSTATGLAFSADGTTLVTATESGASPTGILVDWKLTPSAWIHAACTSAGRNLTPALWRQYVDTRSPSKLRCTT